MPERFSRRMPAWFNLADAVTLALLGLAAVVFLTGGWRTTVAGVRVSTQSGWRLLLWAGVVAAARHAGFRAPSLPARCFAGVAAASRVVASAVSTAGRPAARAGRRAVVFGRDLVRAPIREAASIGPGLAGCLDMARQSRTAIAAAILLVVFRTFVFAWWEQAAFNSDHAIVGLMAKHLAEGRAFPLFFYGQSYMLGVEAWLAAPIFLVAGPSVLGLELPLVALNVLVASLLIVLLRRELNLGATCALAASMVFVLAPPATALPLVEANGGSVETFLYILLLWMLRARPALFGITLGFGFLHREFTIYGLLALAVLRLASGRPLSRESFRRAAIAAAWFCATWGGVQLLKVWSSPFGPGTSVASAGLPRTNLGELLRRSCWSPGALAPRFLALWNSHLDVLYGTGPHSLGFLGVRSRMAGQGFPGLSLAMQTALVVATARIAVRRVRGRVAMKEVGFAAYLLLVGVASMAVYWTIACEPISHNTIRYDMLGLLAVVGFAAAFFRLEQGVAWRRAALVAVAMWAAVSGFSHARLLEEYLLHPPPNDAREAAKVLLADGVTHARANYWVAYRLTFLTGERLVVASEGPVRIRQYQDAKGVPETYVTEYACEGGTRLAGLFHRCPGP